MIFYIDLNYGLDDVILVVGDREYLNIKPTLDWIIDFDE